MITRNTYITTTYKSILLFVIFLFTNSIQATIVNWTPLGPSGGSIFVLQESTTEPGTLYAGTFFGGLYKTVDWGAQWQHVSAPFSESSIFSIEIDNNHPENIYISTFKTGIWYSNNSGVSWEQANNGIQEASVNVVKLIPGSSTNILAGTGKGIYLSIDGGLSWSITEISESNIGSNAFVFDPFDSNVIYAATPDNGVYRSLNGGLSWSPLSIGLEGKQIVSISIDPLHGNEIIAASLSNVYRLIFGTEQWQNITFDLPDTLIRRVVKLTQNNEIFLATDTGVYRSGSDDFSSWTKWLNFSTQEMLFADGESLPYLAAANSGLLLVLDDGNNIIQLNKGIQNIFAGALASIDVSNTGLLYAGTGSGPLVTSTFFTPTLGEVWIPGNLSLNIFDLAPHPEHSEILLAGTGDDGIWASFNYGFDWVQASNGLVPNKVYSISQSPLSSQTLYAGTSDGLFLSRDNGVSWSRGASTEEILFVTAVEADPVRPGVTFIGTSGAVFATFDDGKNVSQLSVDLPENETISDIIIVPWNDIFVITEGGGLFSSNESAEFANWSSVKPGVLEPTFGLAFNHETPWVLYMATSGGGVYKSESNGINWTPINNGLTTPYIFSILVDKTDSKKIYAGTNEGVFLSIDSGDNWKNISNNLPSGNIIQIEQSTLTNNSIYLSISGKGLYQSTDEGITWSAIANGKPFEHNIAFEVSPNDNNLIYADGGSLGVQRSINNGVSWSASSSGMSVVVHSLTFDPTDGQKIYAASLRNGIFRSLDGGDSWHFSGLEGETLLDITVSKAAPNEIFVGTSEGVQASFDSGLTWRRLNTPFAYIFSLLYTPDTEGSLYVGTATKNGIYRTTDGAGSWEKLHQGIPEGSVLALAKETTKNRLFASIEQGKLLKSLDNGLTWDVTLETSMPGRQITHLHVDPQANFIFASSDGDGIYLSIDNGDSWFQFNNGLGANVVTSVTSDPFNDIVYYASVLHDSGVGAGIYKYSPGLNLWNEASSGLPENVSINTIVTDSANSGIIFAASESGIFKSMDSANTWKSSSIGLPLNTAITSLVIDPNDSKIIYVGTRLKGVYKSIDAGASWISANSNIETTSISAFIIDQVSGTLYAGTLGEGLVYSKDGAKTWSVPNVETLTTPFVLSVNIDQNDPNTLYAGTSGEGILKSVDHGLSWAYKNNGLDNLFVFSLTIDPINTSTLYAGTNLGGVYVSEDSGNNWFQSNNGLFHRNVTDIVVDSLDHHTIYIGTEGGGVFQGVNQ